MRIKGDVKGWADSSGSDIWEEHAEHYLNSKLLAHSSVISQIAGRAEKSSAILELGCGSGTYSIALAREGYRVLASDYQDSALKLSRERSKKWLSAGQEQNIEFKKLDAQNIDLPDESLDLVYNVGVIEHLDIDRVLAESARVLKPGGVKISIVPFDSLRWLLLFRLSAWINRGNVWTQLLSKKEWRAAYSKHFTDIKILPVCFFGEALLMRLFGPGKIYRKIVPRILNTDIMVIGKKAE